jgi:hypothetical protein
MNETKGIGEVMNSRKNCPFIGELDKDCYCVDMTSLKVLDVIKFCSGQYELCLIYQKKIIDKNDRQC